MWNEMQYLVIELETLEEHSLTFNFDLYKQEKQEDYDIGITLSVLPQVMTTLPVNLQVLDSQTLFPPLTEGKLRMMIYGKPITSDEISCMKFTTAKCHKEQKILIKNIYFSDNLPEIYLVKLEMLDELGQWIKKS